MISCDNCGVCCSEIGAPPFIGPEIDHLPDELKNEVLEKGFGSVWDSNNRTNTTCYWFDKETKQCMHYEDRPQICQDFEVGSDSCLSYRRYYNIEG